jgi:hypothetical protein
LQAIPTRTVPATSNRKATIPRKNEQYKVLQVDEDEVAAELEELKRNATMKQQRAAVNKPHLLFDTDEDDIPNTESPVCDQEQGN